MPKTLIIAFAGTPAFAVPALRSLLKSRHRVAVVYTQPDRPAGRGRRLQLSPVKEYALANNLVVEQPSTLRTDTALATLSGYRVDVMIVVAYGLILPTPVLEAPPLGCLNIHASLLPRWRGAAPIQRALLAGDEQTGVAIMSMEAGLDTGPVLLEKVIDINPRDTTGMLHDRLASLGAEALLESLDGLIAGTLVPRTQSSTGVTYARKILKEEAVIDWSRPAIEIDRLVRAFNPAPVAATTWRGQQVKVWEAMPVTLNHNAAPGTVLSDGEEGILVAAGSDALRLIRLQLAGRKPTSAADFLNAHRISGDRLGDQAAAT